MAYLGSFNSGDVDIKSVEDRESAIETAKKETSKKKKISSSTFENAPPSKEALAQSQSSAVARSRGDSVPSVQDKNKTIIVNVGKDAYGNVQATNINKYLTEEQVKQVSKLASEEGRLSVENVSSQQFVDSSGSVFEQRNVTFSYDASKQQDVVSPVVRSQYVPSLGVASVSRKSIIESAFQKAPTVSPSLISVPSETTRVDLGGDLFTEKDFVSAGFKPIIPQSTVDVANNLPVDVGFKKKFEKVEEKLFSQSVTEPLKLKELPIAVGVVGAKAVDVGSSFLQGFIVDPIKAIATPVESIIKPVAETSAGLITGDVKGSDVVSGVQQTFFDDPVRFAGNVAFDIASGKLLSTGLKKYNTFADELAREKYYNSLVTEPYSVGGKPVIDVLTPTESGKLVKYADTVKEGYLPIFDDAGKLKGFQSQLIAKEGVLLDDFGLPVSKSVGVKDTGFLLQRQTNLPNIKVAPETITYYDASQPFKTIKVAESVTPSTQSTLGSFGKTTYSVGASFETAPFISKAPFTVTAKNVPSRLRSFEPVGALFETATDPEFLSYASKQFETLKRGLSVPTVSGGALGIVSTPTTFYAPVSGVSLVRGLTTTQSFAPINEFEFGVEAKAKAQTKSALAIDLQPVIETESFQSSVLISGPALALDVVTKTKSKSSLAIVSDVVSDLKQEEEQRFVAPVSVVSTKIVSPTSSFDYRRVQPVIPFVRGSETKNSGFVSGFDVFVRRKGVFEKVSKTALSRSEALDLGAFTVSTSARASFKLSTSSAILGSVGAGVRGSFQTFGVNLIEKNGLFIEKKEKRIKSKGELAEITFKGILSRRIKKRRGLF